VRIRNTEAFLVLAQALGGSAQLKAAARYSNLLRNVRVQSWKTHNRAIVAMAEAQQAFMIVIFGLVGIISVLVVFVVFYMIISHKSKDIGVFALFLIFGLLVGISGSVLGALGGVAIHREYRARGRLAH
jgi:ABC-type lipoprotein release transport system permease subunit